MIDHNLEYQAGLLAALDYVRMALEQIELAAGIDVPSNRAKREVQPPLNLAEINIKAELKRVRNLPETRDVDAGISAKYSSLIRAMEEMG